MAFAGISLKPFLPLRLFQQVLVSQKLLVHGNLTVSKLVIVIQGFLARIVP